MLGWLTAAAAWASRLNRSTKPGSREKALGEHLDGDEAVEGDLAGLIDRAHAAAAEEFGYLEVAEGLADERIDLVGEFGLAWEGEAGLAARADDLLVNRGVHLEDDAAFRAPRWMLRYVAPSFEGGAVVTRLPVCTPR